MIKTAFINIAILGALILGVEACSWSVLTLRGKPQPFLIDATVGFGKTLQAPDHFMHLRHLDPLLGWGYDPASTDVKNNLQNEYAVLGSNDARVFRIVISGGSTTDSFHQDPKWPSILTKKLRDNGYCVKVFVGAITGYNANQEMLKMLRDQHALQPQLHISYSGVNEHEKNWYTLSSNYLVNIVEKIVGYRRIPFLPNTIWLLGDLGAASSGQVIGVNRGLDQPHAPADRWINNQRRMHALAKEFDYEFLGVLQPLLGMGQYSPSEAENKIIREMNLISEWSDFYQGARKMVKEKPYLHDFVDALQGHSELFVDDCHLTVRGNEVVAQRMYELLLSKYAALLKIAQIPDCAP